MSKSSRIFENFRDRGIKMKYFKTKISILFIILFIIPILNGIFNKNLQTDIVKVYDVKNNKILDININDYLVGVVSAEMPAEFEYEALKAQIIACRTYLESKDKCDKNKSADICTDSSHCQAYLSNDELKEKWGTYYNKYITKIKNAVKDTNNLKIYYQNKPIKAVYHSTSSGKTENSADVWGSDMPYLKSVDSSFDKDSPKYVSKYSLSLHEFKSVLKDKYKDIDFNNEIFSDIIRSEGGSVKEIKLYNKLFTGNEIRNTFKLQSSNFNIEIKEDNIHFNVYGYGHGVGMSQYGANFLAKKGYDYRDILSHYYTDVDIK